MPGFRFCPWCNGRGCMCCDGERAKWEKREKARLEAEAKKDPRQKLRELQDPLLRAIVSAEGGDAPEVLDRQIAEAEATCDAEYNRQFPNGPAPIFTARSGNSKDKELLKRVFHVDRLNEAFDAGGRGMTQILEDAEKARGEQDPAIEYKPIGQPAPAPAKGGDS